MDILKKEKQVANQYMKRCVTSLVIKEMQVKTMKPPPPSDWQLLKGLITIILGKGVRARALSHAHVKEYYAGVTLSLPVAAGWISANPQGSTCLGIYSL